MKFQHPMFDFHGNLNRHPIKAHRLPAPSRLRHLRNQRTHKTRLAAAAHLYRSAHHLALLQVHALAGQQVVQRAQPLRPRQAVHNAQHTPYGCVNATRLIKPGLTGEVIGEKCDGWPPVTAGLQAHSQTQKPPQHDVLSVVRSLRIDARHQAPARVLWRIHVFANLRCIFANFETSASCHLVQSVTVDLRRLRLSWKSLAVCKTDVFVGREVLHLAQLDQRLICVL
jgi:hypothetical protein